MHGVLVICIENRTARHSLVAKLINTCIQLVNNLHDHDTPFFEHLDFEYKDHFQEIYV